MPQSPTHRLQLLDGRINLIGLGQKHISINNDLATRGQHDLYLVQRETCSLSECDNSQLLNHGRRKLAASPARAD
ncbi:hypothetical protein PS914_01441 [Pseudomonas fluorescens]|uniref:Uncharacterized protein n=1 Tax=Pseudomonas fluorescens TaxID=294 RepID=A0A5E6ZGQ0_PSEFL|nr:hypothetical protein PS833_00049 [Pseudomonas fluorescens]VVP73107.1 hypothetical protein PS914_01441 [Pseudomonas fluorescens]